MSTAICTGLTTDNQAIFHEVSQPQTATPPAHLTVTEARDVVGRRQWERLNEAQRHAASEVNLADINEFDITTIFGPGSNGARANQIALRNPVAYQLLRNRAVDAGVLAR